MLTGLIITLVGCILFFLLLANIIYSKKSYVYTKSYYSIILGSMGMVIVGMAWIMISFVDFFINLII